MNIKTINKTLIAGLALLTATPVATVSVFAQDSTTTTSSQNSSSNEIVNDKKLTLQGDPIAVQKIKIGKSMQDLNLVKVVYLNPGAVVELSGPYADFGGYVIKSDKLPNKKDKYTYVLNDEGLSQEGDILHHKQPDNEMSPDEPAFNKASKKWASKLNKKQYASINVYSRNYEEMNNYLRGLTKKASKKTLANIKNIDKAMSSYKNPVKTTLYRGLSTDGFKAGLLNGKKIKVGAKYQDKGYMSTSFDMAIAKKYATGVILQIEIPKGKNTGAYIGNISDWKIEKEYLLNHGSEFKITDVQKLGENKLITLKYLK
ncbi:MAG: ADP-ribosylating toxin [Lactobacillaceae bacterium]|jgi:hypothetical protein|nr:ADP-ribosylating toxin [Lactobacillaceae bacterium]